MSWSYSKIDTAAVIRDDLNNNFHQGSMNLAQPEARSAGNFKDTALLILRDAPQTQMFNVQGSGSQTGALASITISIAPA